MNRGGPIIIIEDDSDDKEMFAEVFNKLNYENKIIFFADSQEALDYLTTTDIEPFIIL
jgi:hypothetical protein